jgi:hypothetical protein
VKGGQTLSDDRGSLLQYLYGHVIPEEGKVPFLPLLFFRHMRLPSLVSLTASPAPSLLSLVGVLLPSCLRRRPWEWTVVGDLYCDRLSLNLDV